MVLVRAMLGHLSHPPPILPKCLKPERPAPTRAPLPVSRKSLNLTKYKISDGARHLCRALALSSYLSKELWRQAIAISMQQPDSPFGQAYAGLDRALTEQICALIARLQALGLVRADIDGQALGELIFNNMNTMFIEFVQRDEAKIPDLRAAIRRQNRILVTAIGV